MECNTVLREYTEFQLKGGRFSLLKLFLTGALRKNSNKITNNVSNLNCLFHTKLHIEHDYTYL